MVLYSRHVLNVFGSFFVLHLSLACGKYNASNLLHCEIRPVARSYGSIDLCVNWINLAQIVGVRVTGLPIVDRPALYTHLEDQQVAPPT